LQQYEQRLIDRFGPLPRQAKALLDSLRIKWIATEFGIEKIILKQNKMVAYFIADQQSTYYQSAKFRKVLSFVQQNPSLCKMKEKETRNGLRLLLSFENVKTIKRALEVLSLVKE
jgi:transcription-repair coupling factor (superfamily II helicase)